MARKALWVDAPARVNPITQGRFQSRAYGTVGSAIREMSGVAKNFNLFLQGEVDAFHDKSRLQRMAADLYEKEAQSAQSEYRGEAEAHAGLEGARGHGNNVAQLEAPSPRTRPGAAKWTEAPKMIEQRRNRAANGVLEIRERQPLSREEEEQSSAISEKGVPENLGRQQLITEELPRKADWINGWSSPLWMKAGPVLTDHGDLQYRANCGSRGWSRNSAQGNGSTDMRSACSASEAVVVLQNRLQQNIPIDSYTCVKVLQMCSKQKDFVSAKQVDDQIIQRRMDKNIYVANTLLHVYVKCGALLDARRVFDQLATKSVVTWNSMIAGYAKSDHAEFALELFNQMRREGVQPDQITYLGVLKACANPLALKWGKEAHVYIRHAGFESDVRVGSALLRMYAKSGSIEDARIVFDRMKTRDVFAWNVMIAGYAEGGHGVEAYRLFLQMRREGFKPDAITFVSILNASASAGALEWVKEVHGHAITAGLVSELRVGNALVHMYAKSGSIDDAQLVFEKMEKRDVVTWNAIIGGLARHGYGHEAYRMFLQMRREGFEPDAVTYSSILNASARAGALDWVKEVHGHASQAGMESDLRVGNALVHMYAKSGSIHDAQLVFDRMEKRDVVTWNAMIGGLAQHGCEREAYRLFLEMRREGFKPDVVTYVSILNAYASSETLEWVKDVHTYIRHAGLESDVRVGSALLHMYGKCGCITEARQVFEKLANRNVIAWTAMLTAYARRGYGEEAYRLFLQMRQEGFQPNAVTYVSILNASASAGALEWVREVHGDALQARLESDLRVGNALVHTYAKSGSIDDARLVFDRMEKRDVVTWTVMIGGLAQHGYGNEALELFREMNADGVKPEGASFVAVLSACCHGGLVDDGKRLFLAMKQDYGIEPDIVHYNCMVDLLGRAGQLEEANLFISDMPVEPDAVTWKALLGACRTYGNVELGELAAEEILKLEPNDASVYVLLSNIYAAAGKWENRSLVRTMMRERGLRKEPGRSWIKVKNKVHEFAVGDTSHPEAKGIYTELSKLTEKLKAEGYIPDTRLVLQDINEEDKELALWSHSEKLAISYGLIHIPPEEPIRITKNLRVCPDCHTVTKLISKVTGREIIARDANRFHHFKDGACSCGDYW